MTTPTTAPSETDQHDPEAHEHEHDNHHHLHIDGKTWIGATIAAVAVYEVAATTVNRALDEPLLPTSADLVSHIDVGKAYRFLTPPWLRNAALLTGGAVLGMLGVAGGVVGMTQIDTPEERQRKVQAIKRLARKTTGTDPTTPPSRA